ncbi:MAG: aminopeptidase P family N-terminal domain-containing protein, partial [Holosporales bacterium]|nr:aminopeptidase P family N-terminal domain-containing protein [Holosporales bacterium]
MLYLNNLRKEALGLDVDFILVCINNNFGNLEYDISDIEAISRFSGSEGKALVSQDKAILLVDGRYIKQAIRQVNKSWIVETSADFNINSLIAKYVGHGKTLGI